jgi:anti-sigma B factor antagonist
MTDRPRDDSQRNDLLQVQRRVNGTGVVVHVAGELDLLTALGLVDELTTARTPARALGPVVIDLTDLTFIASVGLSILIAHDRLCRAEDMELRVVAGNRVVARRSPGPVSAT